MEDEYTGPKVYAGVGPLDSPHPDYVTWLEAKVAELKSQLTAARHRNALLQSQINAIRVDANRRSRWDHDHVPYGDDDHDR